MKLLLWLPVVLSPLAVAPALGISVLLAIHIVGVTIIVVGFPLAAWLDHRCPE